MIWKLAVPFNPWASSDCSHIDRGSIASPDEKWEARVVYFSCGSALTGYLRDFTVVAIMKPAHDPSGSAVAIEVEHKELQEWRLSLSDVVWQNASRLQITVPESVETNKLKPRVGAVSIDLKRVPDRLASH